MVNKRGFYTHSTDPIIVPWVVRDRQVRIRIDLPMGVWVYYKNELIFELEIIKVDSRIFLHDVVEKLSVPTSLQLNQHKVDQVFNILTSLHEYMSFPKFSSLFRYIDDVGADNDFDLELVRKLKSLEEEVDASVEANQDLLKDLNAFFITKI